MKFSAVNILIAANVAMYVLQLASTGAMGQWVDLLALWPLQAVDGQLNFHIWQIVTYSFLHSTDNY